VLASSASKRAHKHRSITHTHAITLYQLIPFIITIQIGGVGATLPTHTIERRFFWVLCEGHFCLFFYVSKSPHQ